MVISPKQMRYVTIENHFHLGGPSYDIVKNFTKLVAAGIINPQNIKLITINYNTSCGDCEIGPVRIYLSDNTSVYLNLTAGYSGAGPHDLCEILKICNVTFNEADILEDQEEVSLRYAFDTNLCYQFKTYEGCYEYSI